MRIGDDRARLVEETNSRPRALRSLGEDLRVLGRSRDNGAIEVGFEHRPDHDGLVRHVALERVEELALVNARELKARHRDKQDGEVYDEEPRPNAAKLAAEARNQPSPPWAL